MDEVFDPETRAILRTDSAGAYTEKHVGVCEHHSVNHSEREWARSTTFLAYPDNQERRSAMAGTEFLDHEWGMLKRGLPRSLSARTAEGRSQIVSYVRAAQWQRMVSTADRWAAFCEAACKFDHRVSEGKALVHSGKFAARCIQNTTPKHSGHSPRGCDPPQWWQPLIQF